ncbi:unnamed protein product [Adineta ricciae]|uniref:Uncharacterized protein n=1 Tax=Adineta ricciae TaxID=249248 RepID=A0A814U714_ADIRI|nr:unnamed protein product [Adineta ricciae]
MDQEMHSQAAYRCCNWVVKYVLFLVARDQLETKFQKVEQFNPSILSCAAVAAISKQDAFDRQFSQWWEDNVRLHVWDGPHEHHPLGSMNRIRRRLYDASNQFRAKKNQQPVTSPQSINEISDPKHKL